MYILNYYFFLRELNYYKNYPSEHSSVVRNKHYYMQGAVVADLLGSPW